MKYLFFILLSLNVFAVENDMGTWIGSFAKKEFIPGHFVSMEAQVRYSFENGSTGQLLFRAGLQKALSEKNEVGFLYGNIITGSSIEQRLTAQLVQKLPLDQSTGKWMGRARFEYRNLEDVDGDALRVRYMLRVDIDKKIKEYTPVLWDELFLNLVKQYWNGDTFFDRNRLFAGLKNSYGDLTYEWGYLNQFIPRDNGDTMEHILVFYMYF